MNMENHIDAGLVEGICVVFENCEFIYIPSEFIHNLEVKGVRKDRYLGHFGGYDEPTMHNMVVSTYVDFTVQEYGDTPEILESSMIFSDKGNPYNGYSRLYRSQDITSIEYIYQDGTKESLYIDYSDEDNTFTPNRYQNNTPVITREVPRGLRVRIASPKTLAKYSEKVDVNKKPEVIKPEEAIKKEIVQEISVSLEDINGYGEYFNNINESLDEDNNTSVNEHAQGNTEVYVAK